MSANVYFWIVYAVVLLCAILSLELSSLLWAGVSFVALLSEIAIVYFGLGMPLLGGVQLAIYAGGVTILLLFAIMMIGETSASTGRKPVAMVVALLFLLSATAVSFLSAIDTLRYETFSVETVGAVFTDRFSFFVIVLAFILSAVLYMANAIVTKKEAK